MAKFKVGDQVKVIGVQDISHSPDKYYRNSKGTIATITYIYCGDSGDSDHYDYDIRGIGRDGTEYIWGVKEDWIKNPVDSTDNELGRFKKAFVHRKLAADRR